MPAKSMPQKAMARTVAQRRPAKLQIAEHIQQGELGGAEVEDLEGQQSADDHHAPGRPAVKTATLEKRQQTVPDIPLYVFISTSLSKPGLYPIAERLFYYRTNVLRMSIPNSCRKVVEQEGDCARRTRDS